MLIRGTTIDAGRGSRRSEKGDAGQDRFATVDTDWRLAYDMSRPHQIRISFPPEDGAAVRRRLLAAVRRMRCEVVRVSASARPARPRPGSRKSKKAAVQGRKRQKGLSNGARPLPGPGR
ncbi:MULTISPECIES: hypothetical protein [Streptomyces]|uniref:Uncharacterized protein n=1 Tax=Streptomyces fimbriatus TaxID=68197 RepID=A0ABW0D381_STRFI